MISKRFLTVALASTLLTLSAQATTYVKCVGSTPAETMQFLIDEEQGVAIFQVSKDLCKGHMSIEDDAVFLSEDTVQSYKNKTTYGTQTGNFGFELKIPKTLSEKFKVNYGFSYQYSETDDAQVHRTLSCSLNTKN